MVIRILATLALISTILASGCCATGADDTAFTRQQTGINLPN